MAGREAVDGQGEKEIAGRRSEIAPAALLHPSSSHAHTTHNTTQRLESVWFLTRVMQRPLGRSQGSSKDRSSLLKKCTGRAVKLYPGPQTSTLSISLPGGRQPLSHRTHRHGSETTTSPKFHRRENVTRFRANSGRQQNQERIFFCCVRKSRVRGGSDSLEPGTRPVVVRALATGYERVKCRAAPTACNLL